MSTHQYLRWLLPCFCGFTSKRNDKKIHAPASLPAEAIKTWWHSDLCRIKLRLPPRTSSLWDTCASVQRHRDGLYWWSGGQRAEETEINYVQMAMHNSHLLHLKIPRHELDTMCLFQSIRHAGVHILPPTLFTQGSLNHDGWLPASHNPQMTAPH